MKASLTQYSAVQCSTAQYSAVQCSTAQYSTVQFADLLRVVPVDGGLLLQRVADEHEVLQTLQL